MAISFKTNERSSESHPTLKSLKDILESKATELDGLVLVMAWASLEGFLAYTYFESSLNFFSSRAMEASKYNIQNQFSLSFFFFF
jgi:hypothetical protein